jgi:hypothetical protein
MKKDFTAFRRINLFYTHQHITNITFRQIFGIIKFGSFCFYATFLVFLIVITHSNELEMMTHFKISQGYNKGKKYETTGGRVKSRVSLIRFSASLHQVSPLAKRNKGTWVC